MSTENNFKNNLYEAAEKKVALIDSTVMPKMLEDYRSIHSSIQGLMNLFESKKLILPDPYKQEIRLADINIPPTEDFSDSEGATVFGIRISEYELSLDFLCNYGLFTVQALTPERIKKLFNFNAFIDWNSLNHFNHQSNSRYFGVIINSVKNSGDSMAIGILNNVLTVTTKKFNDINKELKALSNIQKELYKIEVRKNILDDLEVSKKYEATNGVGALEIIKKHFPALMSKKKFYANIIEEIIKEDFDPDKESLRNAVLEVFHTETKKQVKVEEKIDTKAMILDVVKIMSSFSAPLMTIQKKIEENHELYQAEKKTNWDKFVSALRLAFGIKPKPIEYKIKTIDMLSNIEKSETIDYYNFIDELQRLTRSFAALNVENSAVFKKLEKELEDEILVFVQKKLGAVQPMYGTLVGFDNFFKSSVHQANRSKVKGLKIDLDLLKNNLLKANKSKAEYVSTITFEKQMDKLGVLDV